MEQSTIEREQVDASQGVTGHKVRSVLAVSCALVSFAMLAALAYYAA